MEVAQYLKELDANSVAPEEKYKNKVLNLSGVISNIDQTFTSSRRRGRVIPASICR
jgi:hypothetical protein